MRPGINLPTATGATPVAVSVADAPITTPLLPHWLRSLVENEQYAFDTREYANDAWLLPDRVPEDVRRELPLVIASYRAAMREPTPQEIAVLLARLAIHFPLPDLPPEHHQLAFADFADDLVEYPIGVVAEAAQDWRRTERWWPKVAELRARCEAILHQRHKEWSRLRFLQWCSEQFDGRVPRLMRRIYGGLHDAGDGAPDWMLHELMQGRREFAGLVFVLPEEAR
jgi:hypothetical protein